MNAHTKQQQDKVFETDFIDSQKSDPPFVHLTDDILQLIIMSQKDNAENSNFFHFFSSLDDSFKLVPSISSEPVANTGNGPPTREGKQSSQDSADARERTISNQELVNNC